MRHWALKAPLPGLRHGSTFYVSILDYSDYSLFPLLSMGQLGEQPVLKSFNLRQFHHGCQISNIVPPDLEAIQPEWHHQLLHFNLPLDQQQAFQADAKPIHRCADCHEGSVEAETALHVELQM